MPDVLGVFDLVGQEAAAERLSQLVAADRLAHALLFEGPEGVGKFTAAMALARGLLCRRPPRPAQSCGECASCVKQETGSHADLHLVTTEAARIKISEIREAERGLALRPVEGGRKVLVIEDGHRMTIEAQNALLKTLEEPPGAAHIILTTSRLRNILPTVVSRCQRVRFAPLTAPQIAEVIGRDGTISKPQAAMIAALAQGSLGRAQSLDVEALTADRDRVADLDLRLFGATPNSAIDAVERAADLGSDRRSMMNALDLLALWLRDQVLLASGGDQPIANVDRTADLESLAGRRGLTALLHRARTVMEARRQLELPFNLNATMIAEQMCLALAGHAEMKPVPVW